MSDLNELRIYILVRKDIEIPPGKLGVQIAHAAGAVMWQAIETSDVERVRQYMNQSQAKIVVGVDNEEKLLKAAQAALEKGLITYIVKDAGRTVFAEPTITCVGIGPCFKEQLPSSIRRLRLFGV